MYITDKKTKKSSFISEFRTNRTKYKRGREPAIQLRVTRNNLKKNSFPCLMNIVTCDRGIGKRTPFNRKKSVGQK